MFPPYHQKAVSYPLRSLSSGLVSPSGLSLVRPTANSQGVGDPWKKTQNSCCPASPPHYSHKMALRVLLGLWFGWWVVG